MADAPAAPAATDPPAAPPAAQPPAQPPAPAQHDGSTDERLTRIENALAALVPGSHAQAQAHTERRLDRPSTVAEQVQAELAKAREKQQREEAEAARASELAGLKQTVAQLAEKPPEPPVRAVTRLMWGTGK